MSQVNSEKLVWTLVDEALDNVTPMTPEVEAVAAMLFGEERAKELANTVGRQVKDVKQPA